MERRVCGCGEVGGCWGDVGRGVGGHVVSMLRFVAEE
jgi:hypothetical protein